MQQKLRTHDDRVDVLGQELLRRFTILQLDVHGDRVSLREEVQKLWTVRSGFLIFLTVLLGRPPNGTSTPSSAAATPVLAIEDQPESAFFSA